MQRVTRRLIFCIYMSYMLTHFKEENKIQITKGSVFPFATHINMELFAEQDQLEFNNDERERDRVRETERDRQR